MVAAVGEGAQAVRVAAAVRPDVVVLDLQLPDLSGVEVIRGLLGRGTRRPGCWCCRPAASSSDVLDAVKAGATGYLVKSAERDGVPRRGAPHRRRRRRLHRRAWPAWCWASTGGWPTTPSGPDADAPRLTDRETEVLRLVAKGLSYKQIAERLVLSHRTVQNHVQNTLGKLQLHNRVELARYAIERASTSPSSPSPPRARLSSACISVRFMRAETQFRTYQRAFDACRTLSSARISGGSHACKTVFCALAARTGW